MSKTPNVFFTSDHHFGHRNMTEKFVMADGRRVRHEFDSMEHCDEEMIKRWNEVIPPEGKVYHLGDLSFSSQVIDKVLARLNYAEFNLIIGNHDPDDPMTWVRPKYDTNDGITRMIGIERKIRKLVSWQFFGPVGEKPVFVACHYPVHPMCITAHHDRGRTIGCLHGHEHRTKVMLEVNGKPSPHEDMRYLNICVENHDYYPLHYDDVVRLFKKRGIPSYGH